MARLAARIGMTRFEADEHYKMALDHYAKRNMEEALANMERALALYPNSAEYLATRGFFFLEHGARDKAIASFDEALKHNQYEMLAHYGLGVLAFKAQDWPKALEHFNLANMITPNRAETLYYLALVQRISNQAPAAIANMQKALALYETTDAKKQARDARAWLTAWDKPQPPPPPR